MKILIVDDLALMRRVIKNTLGCIGFNYTDEAIDGESALEKLKKNHYSLVISDWNMSPMNGLQLVQHMKINLELCKIPFIMVTVENNMNKIMQAKNAGVNGYVVKPFTVDVLKTQVYKALHMKL